MKYALLALILLAGCKKSNTTPAPAAPKTLRIHVWASNIVGGQQTDGSMSMDITSQKGSIRAAFRYFYNTAGIKNFDSTFTVNSGDMYSITGDAYNLNNQIIDTFYIDITGSWNSNTLHYNNTSIISFNPISITIP